MATTEINKKEIIAKYMDYVLEHGKAPASIYKFSKDLNIEEKHFYNYYNSFEDVATDIYAVFFDETYRLITEDENFQELDAKNQLLIFYYTFFELLTANRSYVLLTLKSNKNILEKFKTLQKLKTKFKDFLKQLDIETLDFQKEEINKISQAGLEELIYKQLLFTLKFWIEDSSPAFEKTDIFIEKSVNASFFLLDTAPIKSLIDLGKFYFKERLKTTH